LEELEMTKTAEQERAAVVAWLRREDKLCDCAAHSEGECACGAWWDWKTVTVNSIIDAIERGDHRQGEQ
jgi:hypothetical protein